MMNGAKGISLLIVSFFRRMRKRLTAAPIQKATIMAEKPWAVPSKNPTDNPSFASPKPIARPRERSQMAAKNVKIISPASICHPKTKDKIIAK